MFKKNCLGALTALGLVCVAGAAHADPRTHDGFQFRLGAGLGYMSDSISLSGGPISLPETSVHGLAFPFELYLGGSLMPGLALGGTFGYMTATGPSVSQGGVSGTLNNDYSLSLINIGPYVDWYLDPKEGLHFLGSLNFAMVDASYKGQSNGNAGTGFGLGLGAGYDFWVSDEWSLGVLGRFSYAHGTYSNGGATKADNVIAPAIEFSAAFN